jgi:Arc/MetJ family transcription regulator
MRTTVVIDENLLKEAKKVSGINTNKGAIEAALRDFVSRKKGEALINLEGKVEFSCSLDEFLVKRKKDVPRR